MSQQQSDKHGPAVDDALQDERRQSSSGTRHRGRPPDDPEHGELADQDELEEVERTEPPQP